MTTRIYLVIVHNDCDQPNSEYLVEASSSRQAILHASQRMIEARVARPKDVARLMASGGQIEVAGGAE